MPNFTKGPWVIGITVGADGWPTYRIRDMNDPTCMKEKLANADLISAAPEMYWACLFVLSYLSANDGKSTGEPDGDVQLMIANKLRAALDKADGGGE